MDLLYVEVPRSCPSSRSGQHRGQWEPCTETIEEGVPIVHSTRYACRLCGFMMVVATTSTDYAHREGGF